MQRLYILLRARTTWILGKEPIRHLSEWAFYKVLSVEHLIHNGEVDYIASTRVIRNLCKKLFVT